MSKPRTFVCVGGPVHEQTFVLPPERSELHVPILRVAPEPTIPALEELVFEEHVYRVRVLRGTGRRYLVYQGQLS